MGQHNYAAARRAHRTALRGLAQDESGGAGYELMYQDADEEVRQFMAKRRDVYVYESEALALASGGQATDTINIEADSNFILQMLTHFSIQSTTVPTLTDFTAATNASPIGLVEGFRVRPLVLVQLVDTGSGRQLMQSAIPIPSIFGDGVLPFILPYPRIFMRNSTIQVQYTNVDPTNAYDVRLAFIGYKNYSTV